MGRFVQVAKTSEVKDNIGTCVEVEGKRIAVFKVDGEFHAIDDFCTHEEAPLSEGEIEGCEVTCPWHGATFNLKTGECTGPPADENISAYKVRVVGEDIEVEV